MTGALVLEKLDIPGLDFLEGDKKVLLVDSNNESRQQVRKLLEKNIQQVEIVDAVSEQDCRKKFEQNSSIAVSVVTARTPDAESVVQYLLEHSAGKPIVGLGRSEEERKRLQDAGCTHVCSYFQVVVKVQELLSST